MEGSPAETSLLPAVPAETPASGVGSTAPAASPGFETPRADEASPKEAPGSFFTAMTKIVSFQKVEMGVMCEANGLGACLKAMADAEKNPILNEGRHLPLP